MGKETEQTFLQRRHASGQQVCEKVPDLTNHQGNAHRNHSERSPHTGRMAVTRETEAECGEGVERDLLFCGWECGAVTMETSMEAPQRTKQNYHVTQQPHSGRGAEPPRPWPLPK